MSVRCAVLLRAVNVAGRNRVPMAELRDLLETRTALQHVSTYIASGNIICDAPGGPDAAAAEVRRLIAERFGVDTPAIARTHAELAEVEAAHPFPDAPLDKMVHVVFLDRRPKADAVDQLTARLQPGERIDLIGRELWIDHGRGGVASTRLSGTVLDRALGAVGTARNITTVRRLVELTAPH